MTVIGDQRAEKSTGISGFGLKLSGGLLMALFWLFILVSIYSEPDDTSAQDAESESTSDSVDFISMFTIAAAVHAVGFTLIVLGWITENSERKNRRIRVHKNQKGFDKTRKI